MIKFGKYKGRSGFELLKDDQYIIWLGRQSWLKEKEPELYDFIRSEEANEYRKELGLGPAKIKETEFIYFIRSGEIDKGGMMRIKIGKTENDVEKRKRQLQTGNPDELIVVDFIEVRKDLDVESILHERFAGKHVRGEWYKLSTKDIESAIENYDERPLSFWQKTKTSIWSVFSRVLPWA